LHLAIYYYGVFGSKAPASLILGAYEEKAYFCWGKGKYALFMGGLLHVYKSGRAVEKWN